MRLRLGTCDRQGCFQGGPCEVCERGADLSHAGEPYEIGCSDAAETFVLEVD